MTGTDSTFRSATILLIILTGALRLLTAHSVGLGVGEAYFFGAARHLSLSYFDQPPAAAFLAWISLEASGRISSLILRLPFVALFAGTTWLMFLTGRRLFGPRAGFLAALFLNITPVFTLSTGIFFQPEGPLMFFWLATMYVLIPPLIGAARGPMAWRQWTLAGAWLGLALLSKYSAIFLVIGALVWIVSGRERRRWLVGPEPWLAIVVATALFLPVLVWNAQHDWISFRWQGARGVAYYGIHLSWLWKNIGGQLVEVSPWIWALLLIEPFRALGGSGDIIRARRFLLCFALPPIVTFTAVAAYADIGNHFHWGTPGYLTLLLSLGATADAWCVRHSRVARVAIAGLSAASLVVMTLAVVQAATGRFSAGNGQIAQALAGGNDPTVEMIDYDALEPAFAARGLLNRPGLFVFSDRWYEGGKIDYAFRGRVPFLLLNRQDPREYVFFDSPARWVGHEGILVSRRPSLAEVQSDYGDYCSTIDPLGPVPIGRRGTVEITLYLYRCAELTRAFPLPYGNRGESPQP